jgi:hypothetical protein
MPAGWTLIRVKNYTSTVLVDMRDWLSKNLAHSHYEANWGGACSYSTGVVFEDEIEACLFKLRWS